MTQRKQQQLFYKKNNCAGVVVRVICGEPLNSSACGERLQEGDAGEPIRVIP
jgi:hypothetical protein